MNNITGSDPMLTALALNGGPTQTHALLCGSPAIDKGHNSLSLTTDQRGQGFVRTIDVPWIGNVGDGTDIGAVEVQQGCLPPTVELYLRATNDLTILFLDQLAPTDASPKFKDSSGLSRQNGNPWREVGTWAANPTSGPLTSVTDARLWFGLKNSADQGTRFDIRCEVYKNDLLVASGEQLCVMGITSNPANAKEVTVLFGPMSPVLLSETDVLSLKVLARIGSNGAGRSCGGHSNATGLRLSFDSISRPSRLVAIP